MLALAVGKFVQKKSTDAKNLLKLLWKMQYTTEYGEDLERAWLLYADSFVAVNENKRILVNIILFFFVDPEIRFCRRNSQKMPKI